MFELDTKTHLDSMLEFGTLPEVVNKKNPKDKREFLKSYVQTYLKEEVISEQIIRKLNPFRNFLKIAAQHNGQILNYSSIARDIKADDKTVKNYFSILEDTLLGFFLPSYHKSVRKQQNQSPKFYFFDTGVKRALEAHTSLPLLKSTYTYGQAFEHKMILECFYLNEYLRKDFNFYYLKTKDQNEVDLIIERPGKKDVLVEIKSTEYVQKTHIKSLCRFKKDWFSECEPQLWSQQRRDQQVEGVRCLFWKQALKQLFF